MSDIAALHAGYRTGDFSPVEIIDEALDRIGSFNSSLNAFFTVTRELAQAQATAAMDRLRWGDTAPLLGVPMCVKDIYEIEGVVTTYGSEVYRENVSPKDSGLVKRLRDAGAIFVGKTNTAEFGQSGTTDNRLMDDCRNPWDLTKTSGGSSGGSAAAVAAGLVTAGVGSDGGGSIRIPAAFCGLFGLRPTIGLCANEGGFQSMSPFVCHGPLTRSVADARLMLAALTGSDYPRRSDRRTLRIAWCPTPEDRPVDPGVTEVCAEAVGSLADLGHTVEEKEPLVTGWQEIFGVLVLAEEGDRRGNLLDTHKDELSDYVRTTLEGARRLGSSDVSRAEEALTSYRHSVQGWWETFDVIVTPTTSVTAFPVSDRPREIDGRRVDSLWGAFPFTAPFSVAGLPAANVPCGLSSGLPVGLQLITPPGRDQLLLDLSEDLQEALSFPTDARRATYA